MCGIVGIAGNHWEEAQLQRMLAVQHHRGPDAQGIYNSPGRFVGLGHNRLSIIDLSDAGRQPMQDDSGRYTIVFNGEVYNYQELRRELESEFRFRNNTDTEVLLYAYRKWGVSCLPKLIGMFSFVIWDEREKELLAVRDRFGVKPFNYAWDERGNFLFASEIKALFAAGFPQEPNTAAWAEYLALGRYDHDTHTFWKGVNKLAPGHFLRFSEGHFSTHRWYDLAEAAGEEFDSRSLETVTEEYFGLLQDNICLRFRADVPVAINISGGLDSSALLALVDKVQGKDSRVKAFTFITGDENYDELPWVEEMIRQTHHPLHPCLLKAEDVPALAASVQHHQDEPYGGLPTLAYARLFEEARNQGVIVLLDGQGMDEQWAGYDYYRKAETNLSTPTVQGTSDSPVVSDTLHPDFAALISGWQAPEVFPDRLRNLQYRDSLHTKIPRALRFNDRISMRSSTELREPFLDHRLFEIAFRQRPEWKIKDGQGKWFMRQLLAKYLPGKVVEAPKRPLQTPQREWLRGPLRGWAEDQIKAAMQGVGGEWLREERVRHHWERFLRGESDNSFYIWQWISLGMMLPAHKEILAEQA